MVNSLNVYMYHTFVLRFFTVHDIKYKFLFSIHFTKAYVFLLYAERFGNPSALPSSAQATLQKVNKRKIL